MQTLPTDAKATEKETREGTKETMRARSFSLPRKFTFKGFSESPKVGRKGDKEDKPRVATVKRSQSTSERRSLPAGTDSVDFGAASPAGKNGQRTSSPG